MKKIKAYIALFSAVTLVAGLVLQVLPMKTADAAQITSRSLTLLPGAVDGGSKPGGTVNHKFDFTVVGGSVGSIKFQYCTTAAPVAGGIDCDLPTGIDTTTATLGSENGATGFTGIDTSTNGTVIISRTAASPAAGTLSYTLNGIKNPSPTNYTFFVRISLDTSLDGTDVTPVDSGTVTAATATQIVLTGTMPESLVFCTGRTVGLTSGVPDCATASDGAVAFDKLFSPTDTATASSQMAASTNAGAGYAISANGPTLTSGSNTIAPIGSTAPGVHGVSQFGLNLRANTTATSTPAVGSEISVASNGTNYRAAPTSSYKTIDNFKFLSSDPIASSCDDGTSTYTCGAVGGSDSQIYTVSYIVNVPGSQPAGTYATTLTYICTATF